MQGRLHLAVVLQKAESRYVSREVLVLARVVAFLQARS